MSFTRLSMALIFCNCIMSQPADFARFQLAPYCNISSQPTTEPTEPLIPQDYSSNAQNAVVGGHTRSPSRFPGPANKSPNYSIDTASVVQEPTKFIVGIGAPTTVQPLDCQNAICSISVAVSSTSHSMVMGKFIMIASVSVRIVLASGILKYRLSFYTQHSTNTLPFRRIVLVIGPTVLPKFLTDQGAKAISNHWRRLLLSDHEQRLWPIQRLLR